MFFSQLTPKAAAKSCIAIKLWALRLVPTSSSPYFGNRGSIPFRAFSNLSLFASAITLMASDRPIVPTNQNGTSHTC